MIDNLRRPTMKEMRRSSSSENCAPKRMGTSLPNLREERHLGILRHTSVTETRKSATLHLHSGLFSPVVEKHNLFLFVAIWFLFVYSHLLCAHLGMELLNSPSIKDIFFFCHVI